MTWLPALLLLVPLVGGGLALCVANHGASRWISRAVAVALMTLGAVALGATTDGAMLETTFGAWSAGLGISLRLDALAAGLVVLSGFMLLTAGFAADARVVGTRPAFHGRALLLTASVCGVFLAADLFNLYVWFELALASTVALLTLDARRGQVRALLPYVFASLLASVVLLTGIVLTYAQVGSLHLQTIAARMELVGEDMQLVLAGMFGLALAIKAAIVPLGLWLPLAYSAATTPVAMLLSALSGKAALSAWFRMWPTLFGPETVAPYVLATIAMVTLVVGVLLAVAQRRTRRILGFHSSSQMGYMLLGLAFLHPVAMAGALVFVFHHAIVKSGLFLCAGFIRGGIGTDRLSASSTPVALPWVLRGTLLLLALSLAGIPPFSGFLAKLTIVRGGLETPMAALAVVAVFVGVLTLLSMLKIWQGTPGVRSRPDEPTLEICGKGRAALLLHLAPAVFAILFGEVIVSWSIDAAEQVLGPRYTSPMIGVNR